MGLHDDTNTRSEEAIRRAAEHVTATRRRLREGAEEIARQRGAVRSTAEHMNGMSRWIQETERQLDAQRRSPRPEPDAA
jgi:phage-related tail protein